MTPIVRYIGQLRTKEQVRGQRKNKERTKEKQRKDKGKTKKGQRKNKERTKKKNRHQRVKIVLKRAQQIRASSVERRMAKQSLTYNE